MKDWFIGCMTLEEIKRRYRELSLEHHPDRGGDSETFVEISNQYGRVKIIAIDSYEPSSELIELLALTRAGMLKKEAFIKGAFKLKLGNIDLDKISDYLQIDKKIILTQYEFERAKSSR